jgi:hypothetical protein
VPVLFAFYKRAVQDHNDESLVGYCGRDFPTLTG